MRVLVVHKTTNFELHAERVEQSIRDGSFVKEQHLENLKLAHDEHYSGLDFLCDILKRSECEYEVVSRESQWPEKEFDLHIAFGGDGTLLTVARHLGADQKLAGFKSSDAGVGYTCVGSVDENNVTELLQGKNQWIDVSRIQVQCNRVEKNISELLSPALNDVLLCNSNPAATTRYQLQIGESVETHKSSGIWIATGVGSTAAIKAAGGCDLSFDSQEFQYRVRELFDPQGDEFSLKGNIFDPSKTMLKFENRSENAIVAIDGQHCIYEIEYGDQVTVSLGPSLTLAMPDKIRMRGNI